MYGGTIAALWTSHCRVIAHETREGHRVTGHFLKQKVLQLVNVKISQSEGSNSIALHHVVVVKEERTCNNKPALYHYI